MEQVSTVGFIHCPEHGNNMIIAEEQKEYVEKDKYDELAHEYDSLREKCDD